MTPSFTRSAEAEQDLIAIWVYVAADDPGAADRLLDRIDEACTQLAEFPDLGTGYEEIRAGLRLFPVRNYLILYRRIGSGVEIVRVIHGARQWQNLL